MKTRIALDIGTSYTKIYRADGDVVLFEPTVIAIKNGDYKKPVATGKAAEKLVGKTPDGVEIIYPVKNAEVDNERALIALLCSFTSKIKKPLESFSTAILSVQCGADGEVIPRFEHAADSAGIYNPVYVEAPVLALVGADMPLSESACQAVIDLGGGQATVCVMNMSGVVSGLSAELGGDYLDKEIEKHLEETVNLNLSDLQTEALKKAVASLVPDDDTKTVVTGKEATSGKTRTMQVSASMIQKPVKEYIDKIITLATMVFDKLPSESLIDVTRSGIYLCGGGSELYGLSDYMSEKLGMKVNLSKEPSLVSVIGGGKLLKDKNLLQKLKLRG